MSGSEDDDSNAPVDVGDYHSQCTDCDPRNCLRCRRVCYYRTVRVLHCADDTGVDDVDCCRLFAHGYGEKAEDYCQSNDGPDDSDHDFVVQISFAYCICPYPDSSPFPFLSFPVYRGIDFEGTHPFR